MKVRWMLLVAAAQVALLVFMAGEREWILRTGQPVVLRTAPLDPDDPMRGAYVRLDHDLNRVRREQCRDGIPGWFEARGNDWRHWRKFRDRRVYATLRIGEGGAAELVTLSDQRPAAGLFLRGRVESIDAAEIQVRFGVEAVFLSKERARRLEDERRGVKAGVPLALDVAVGPGGVAVIRGHRWEPLGITVELDPPAERPARGVRRGAVPAAGANVVLTNHSAHPVAIVDRPGGGALRLVAETRWGWTNNTWALDAEPLAAPTAGQVVVLPPGGKHTIRVDFADPRWRVRHRDEEKAPERVVALAEAAADSNVWYRFVYVAPATAETAGWPQAVLVWRGELRSRAFTLTGGTD